MKMIKKANVWPDTTRRLLIAGNCNPKYILPINLKIKVEHTKEHETSIIPLIFFTKWLSMFNMLLKSR